MSLRRSIGARWRRFREDESGTTLTELAVALGCFLFIFFSLIDFGRLGYHYVTAEKAMHLATRIAVVRPPACTGVPQVNARGPLTSPAPRFGSSCAGASGTCANPGTVSCPGSASNATAAEIWDVVGAAMPQGTTIANLHFSYAFDENLGFLGGPYVPMVTVELRNTQFAFVSPLGQLAQVAGATNSSGLGATINLPSFSVSMPGEDLALGTNG